MGCDAVLITRAIVHDVASKEIMRPFVETAAREVYDVTGAGDTVIATLGAALARRHNALRQQRSLIMRRA